MLRDVAIHLILCIVGALVGFSGFFAFFFGYNNYHAGLWALASAAIASKTGHLHWAKGKDNLERWYNINKIRILNTLGFTFITVGIAFFIWYLFLTLYHKIPIEPINGSTIISAVWAMISAKWGGILMYYTNKYEIIIIEGSTPVLAENNA